MEIKKIENGDELEILIKGRLDTITSPELEKALVLDQVSSLILNLKDLEYISSAGLRVILSAHKYMSKKGKLIIRNVTLDVMMVFELTNFNSILTIE